MLYMIFQYGQRTDSKPPDINRFQSHNAKFDNPLLFQLYKRLCPSQILDALRKGRGEVDPQRSILALKRKCKKLEGYSIWAIFLLGLRSLEEPSPKIILNLPCGCKKLRCNRENHNGQGIAKYFVHCQIPLSMQFLKIKINTCINSF